MTKTPTINLLKKNRNFLDQLIKWSLTVGRLIIILTEVIALSAFLYRFSLDRKLIDLHEKIKQKQIILDLFKENEEKYRNIQKKLEKSKEVTVEAEKKDKLYNDVLAFASELSLTNISITEKNLRIEANTNSLTSLVQFIKNLKNYNQIQTISLDKIENKSSLGLLGAIITATLKDQAQTAENF